MDRLSHHNAIAAMKSLPLFAGLEDAAVESILSGCEMLNLRAEAQILRMGRPADRFFIVLSGRVKIFKLSARGDEQILHLYGPGQSFGEAAMWANVPYPAYADAVTDTRLLVVHRQTIRRALSRNVEMAMDMLAGLSGKLQEFAQLIHELSLKDVPSRLAGVLMEESAKAGAPRFRLGGTKRDLAGRIGTVPETLSRALAKLKKDGLIDVQGSQVSILDAEGLAAAAQGE